MGDDDRWPLSDEEIRYLLRSVGITDEPESITLRADWQGQSIYIESESDGVIILECFPHGAASAHKEVRIRQRIRDSTTVPVPRVKAVVNEEPVTIPTIVSQVIGGLPVFDLAGLSPANQITAFESYGRILASLREVPIAESFGPVSTDGTSLIEGTRHFYDWFVPQCESRLRQISDTPLSHYEHAVRDRFQAIRPDLNQRFSASLVKGSYRFEHLLVESAGSLDLRAVRGFHKSLSGPAEYDYALGYWHLCERPFRSPSFRDAFDKGYQASGTIPTSPAAKRRRDLYWLDELVAETNRIAHLEKMGELSTAESDRHHDRLGQHFDRLLES